MKNNICENCGNEHDGSYGSGRFCSDHCRRVYSGKHINKNGKQKCNFKNTLAVYGTWKCSDCNLIFRSRAELYTHRRLKHARYDDNGKRINWNKGLTSKTDNRIAKSRSLLKLHYAEGKVHSWCEGKNLPSDMKKKISESMKKAHAEGRAHNIGESRWNNEPSYPEKWFMKVIANEFDDKNYVREYPFHKYSLDFAWLDKKKCIEIDGDQHQRFEEYKERDEKKNELLKNEHWKVLRLIWKDVCAQPKKFIKLAKDFIGI